MSAISNVFFTINSPLILQGEGVSGLSDYSVYSVLPFEILNSQRVGRPSFYLLKVYWWLGGGGGLFDYSVYLWPRFVKV